MHRIQVKDNTSIIQEDITYLFLKLYLKSNIDWRELECYSIKSHLEISLAILYQPLDNFFS